MTNFIKRIYHAVKVLDYKAQYNESFPKCIYMTNDTMMHLALYHPSFTITTSGKKYFLGYEVKCINSNMIIIGEDVEIYDSKD